MTLCPDHSEDPRDRHRTIKEAGRVILWDLEERIFFFSLFLYVFKNCIFLRAISGS
jgi:hypothetical protein